MTDHAVLDLFAGTGWGVALQELGVPEYGVDNEPAVLATRTANGMHNAYEDAWDAHLAAQLDFDTLIASPPCQAFSMAGRGAGREALEEVLQVIADKKYRSIELLQEESARYGDARVGLVLSPLYYAWKFKPEYVVLEQVPPVLPVWEAMAEKLRLGGYRTWTGIVNAEQYGVPQTRKRAILIARLGGPVGRPRPTHSLYYSRTPLKLDEGVQSWVSMAEALSWGMTERPYPTIATGTEAGGTDPAALGGSGARKLVYGERARGAWAPSGDPDNDGGILRLTPDQAAAIQSYPAGWGFTKRPALTVTGHGLLTRHPTGQKKAVAEAIERGEFVFRPPFTAESATKGGEQREDYLSLSDRFEPDSVNASPEENAALQGYPPFHWDVEVNGKPITRGKKFLQIGNAVPPLMARAILQEAWGL